jgi:hypothetical protein
MTSGRVVCTVATGFQRGANNHKTKNLRVSGSAAGCDSTPRPPVNPAGQLATPVVPDRDGATRQPS